MPWHASLDQLVDVLTNLYNGSASARRIAASAGLNLGLINFDGAMRNTWYAILEEAVKQGKVEELVDKARAEYKVDAALAQAQAAYLAWRQQPVVEPPPVPAPARPLKLTNPQKWELVDALVACPSIKNRGKRDAVVGNLRGNIQDNVERDDAVRLDVYNIVTTALNYVGGVQELVEAVRKFDADTDQMAEVDRVMASFG